MILRRGTFHAVAWLLTVATALLVASPSQAGEFDPESLMEDYELQSLMEDFGPESFVAEFSPWLFEVDPIAFQCPPPPGVYPEPDPCVIRPVPPSTPEFPDAIDDKPDAPEWYCDPTAKEGVSEFRRILVRNYGIGATIERQCDVTWGYEFSYHKMGLALDWRVDVVEPDEWAKGLSLIDWLLSDDTDENEFAMARRLGITQIIWNNRIWSSDRPTWRVYCQTDACLANRTLRHDDHMHISFSVEGAYLHTSYYE
ncbi:MAG: hypothetical protein ABFR95_11025, partial [Actinomycetota bacterium]